ncbi:sigma-70 family RNA polymerase sigma factor [Polaribacter cellanae]|uniref:Sigma-70 family RNA polymerase sigma factor n=1 Tax=Polaribacter cellanae TaxID=2818493 RepID=A0A975H731_9FLAO|nr:sigma-70 family RNA polymerase sigma factor [Polaribacter cellanae]QTE22559.1 sigma-70 family RNA polymerase sigma factor [Polaribacter cellanae]
MVATKSIHIKENFKQIFDDNYEALVLYATRFLPLKETSEDLVQDIFADLWNKEQTFPDNISLKSYLYKVTRNKCYNVIKHYKVKDKHSLNTIKTLHDDNLFFKHILEEEIVKQLYQAIETLSDRKKEIIKLSLKGIKNNEISENLGIKLQTVKTLKSQAYKTLREQFRELENTIYFLLFGNKLISSSKKNTFLIVPF